MDDLPDFLATLFWDYSWETISWKKHADFVTRRILQAGDWDAVIWLRSRMGDDALRLWLEEKSGAGLSPRQLRFWELVLSIDPNKVYQWMRKSQYLPWAERRVR